jgi:hypothetical protein
MSLPAQSRRPIPAAMLAGCACAMMACGVDDERVLQLAAAVSGAQPGAGGAGGDGGGGAAGNAGEGGLAGQGGGGGDAAGAAGSPTPPAVRCPDLNVNQIPDCDETLLPNALFDTDISGWVPGANAEQRWQATNATGFPGSGSLLLKVNVVVDQSVGSVLESTSQCVPVQANQGYDLGVQVYIRSGQGTGVGGLNLLWYSDEGCESGFLSGAVAAKETVDRWVPVTMEVAAPPGARSLRLRLAATKPYAQESFEVLFDNVLFLPR